MNASLLVWSIEETEGVDSAWVSLDTAAGRLSADGAAIGQTPEPWTLRYAFESGPDWITRSIAVEVRTAVTRRTLELRRDDQGWTVNGRPRPDLADALDCDLAACPLTNTMPVLRHGLLSRPGAVDFVMAFITVPELEVVPNRQLYTHLRRLEAGGAVIRYESGRFRSDLTFDGEGFVVHYPQLGRRIAGVVSAE